MDISHGNISRFNLSIILIRTININVRESLLHTRIKGTEAIKVTVLKQTLKSRYSLRRSGCKSSHHQAKIRSIRGLLSVLSSSSSKDNYIVSYFSHVIRIKIRIAISIKIAFSLDLRRSIKLTSSKRKINQNSYSFKIFRIS